ncbi:MAG TPA: ABC transporter permease, partial [Puia sp.]
MIKNYFKIAWRQLRRNKAYAFINVAGLTLGITCSIIIFVLVHYELSFDNFHTNKDRIYRVVTEIHHDDISYTSGTPSPMGKALRDDYAFADKIARVRVFGNPLVSITSGKDIHKFVETGGLALADPEFFDIFHFPFVKGDRSILADPNTAVITENLAAKYFPGQDPIGRILRIENSMNFTVRGVLKDLPANTDRTQEIYLPFVNLKDFDSSLAGPNSWSGINNNMQCFVLLKKGVTPASVEG